EAARADGEFYGRARLEALLDGLGDAGSAAEIGEAVHRDVAAFTGDAEASDDMAILVLRFTVPPPPARPRRPRAIAPSPPPPPPPPPPRGGGGGGGGGGRVRGGRVRGRRP